MLLGSAMRPRCACRGEAGVGRGGRGANGRGGHGPSCLHRIMFLCSAVFARASGGTRASDRAAGCPWGVPWGRGARVEVRRVWGISGGLPLAAGVMGPHAFTALCFFALLSSARASGGTRASDRGAGCPWGVPWGRGARVEVRWVWGMGGVVPMAAGGMGLHTFTASCFFALLSFARVSGMAGASDRAAGCSWGATWGRDARVEVRRVRGDMHLVRTPISTPPGAHVSRRSGSVPGTLVLPDRGIGGRQRGLGGDVKF